MPCELPNLRGKKIADQERLIKKEQRSGTHDEESTMRNAR
jgi:hypothetical protein